MVTVSDILKVLDKIPEWAGLKAMQGRIDELESRCADLEERLSALETKPKAAPGQPCEACGEPAMRVTKSVRDPVFGDLGGSRQTWTCGACGFEEEKLKK